jgi:integrase
MNLKDKTNRLKLPVRDTGKPYWVATATAGVSLGYRRLEGRAGTWCARLADGHGRNTVRSLEAIADDLEEANGRDVLSFAQASDKARNLKRGEPATGLTVERALAEYDERNPARLAGNSSRVRFHLGCRGGDHSQCKHHPLFKRELTQLTVKELEVWRDGIKATPATVNRTIRILKAALTEMAERYPEQVTRDPWRVGLKQKAHLAEARNVVLSDDQVRDLIAAAYAEDPAWGLYVEVGAVTGARPSQIVRLEVRDLQLGAAPRLMMPTSRKGSAKGVAGKARHIAVQITTSLAGKLQQAAAGRGPSEPLLARSHGDAWSATSHDHREPFERAVAAAGVVVPGQRVTFYALRHSSIVRHIKANKAPLRTIAAMHDTSVGQIEKNYSRDITHYDDSTRAGLLEVEVARADNVVALR